MKSKGFVDVKTSPMFRNWAKSEAAKRGMTLKNFLDMLAEEGGACEKKLQDDMKKIKRNFKIGF